MICKRKREEKFYTAFLLPLQTVVLNPGNLSLLLVLYCKDTEGREREFTGSRKGDVDTIIHKLEYIRFEIKLSQLAWCSVFISEFFERLGRARKDGRAQYLKIQAIELVETKDKSLLKVAEELLNRMLSGYPDDNFNKASALNTLGDILMEECSC